MNHKARDKAAEAQAEKQFFALRGFVPGETEWKDLQYGNELRAYTSSYLAGYAAAQKEYEVSLRVAIEHITNARSEASSVNITRDYIIDELCLALSHLGKITED